MQTTATDHSEKLLKTEISFENRRPSPHVDIRIKKLKIKKKKTVEPTVVYES